MNRDELYSGILSELESMPIVSTHEHHQLRDPSVPMDLAFVLSRSYVGWCEEAPPAGPSDVAAYMAKVEHKAYFRWLSKALTDLYGMAEGLSPETWWELSQRIEAAHSSPGWFDTIFHDKCRYQRAILDCFWAPGTDNGRPDLYSPTLRMDPFVLGCLRGCADHDGNTAQSVLGNAGIELPAGHSFADFLSAVEMWICSGKARGGVSLKLAVAYMRSLVFGEVEFQAARAAYEGPNADMALDTTLVGDYVVHWACERAAELGLPVQVHTGLGRLGGSRPSNLIGLIEAHPKTVFSLFHGGYPWVDEIGGMLHNYGNVVADLVWLPLISPTAACSALAQWVEVSRVSGRIMWGGDCLTPEESYGSVLAVQHVLARVVAEQVASGYFSLAQGLRLCEQVLSKSAAALYGFTNRHRGPGHPAALPHHLTCGSALGGSLGNMFADVDAL